MNAGFSPVFKLDDAALLRLEEALEEVSPGLDGNAYMAAVAEKAHLAERDIYDILRVLIRLYLGRKSGLQHPLAPLAGAFDAEPLWDEVLQAMQEYRKELNEQEDLAE